MQMMTFKGGLPVVDFEKLYFRLFAAMADAVEALEQNRPQRAREILIEAQLAAEEVYISDES